MDPWQDELITQYVNQSNNLRQVLSLMGLKDGGMTRKKLKDRIVALNLDTSHFKIERDKTSVWNDKELVEEAVKRSLSIADVVRNMNQTVTGSSYAAAKRAFVRFGLSTTHFDPRAATVNTRQHLTSINGAPPLDQVLVENSTYNRSALRQRIIRLQLIPYVCRCGNTGVWLNEPLTLQLEHKNGINNDHRLENLEFLCPNCHTQTTTWGRKKRSDITHKE